MSRQLGTDVASADLLADGHLPGQAETFGYGGHVQPHPVKINHMFGRISLHPSMAPSLVPYKHDEDALVNDGVVRTHVVYIPCAYFLTYNQ